MTRLPAVSLLSYTRPMRHSMSRGCRILITGLLLVLSGLLGGCLSSGYWVWQHPQELSIAELHQAKIECRQLAEQQIDRFDYYYPNYYQPFYNDYYYYPGRHRQHYWRQPRYDFYHYNRDLDRLYNVCMQAKGWQLIHYESPPPKTK